MALHSFCGILTLQVGVAIIAVVFWVIATLIFVVNFFEFFEQPSFPVFALTISTFVILLILVGLIAFFAAYNESNSLCMTGVALTCLITVVWVIISSLSFYNERSILKFVCVNDRCPESFWLAPLKYRLTDKDNLNIHNHGPDDDLYHEHDENSTVGGKRKRRSLDTHFIVQPVHDGWDKNILRIRRDTNITVIGDDDQDSNARLSVSPKSGYKFGLPLIGAVVLFICNFFLFLFSILVLWSYGQQLAWTNSYLQDIPDYTHS